MPAANLVEQKPKKEEDNYPRYQNITEPYDMVWRICASIR